MTVAYSDFTVRLRIRLSIPCVNVYLSGSTTELGSWSEDKWVKCSQDCSDSTEFSFDVVFSGFGSSFKFRYLAEFGDASMHLDVIRAFRVPPRIASSLGAGKVLIEVKSKWSEPNSVVSIFVPSGPLCGPADFFQSFQQPLQDVKRMIRDLSSEKEALRAEIVGLSSSMFEKPEEIHARLSELHCNKVIKDLLYEINELKGKVKVVARFRPLIEGESGALDFSFPNSSSVIVHGSSSPRVFHMDEVFDADVDNEAFYELSNIKSAIESSVLISNNVCIFSYGQTNSGKSHTVIGSRGEKGIVELTLNSVFGLLRDGRVQVEMIEIYRENVFQLIDRTEVRSKHETMNLFLDRIQDRATASTFMNPTSSRSHCVFIISLVSAAGQESSVFLVDLAGSERTKISGAEGDRLAEANSINKSLSTLGLVLNSLLNRRPFIPYRDSKLTKILAPIFQVSSPPSKVIMIANVSSNVMDERETLSTLQFAQRVGEIELSDNRGDQDEANRKIDVLNQIIEQQKLQLDQLRLQSTSSPESNSRASSLLLH